MKSGVILLIFCILLNKILPLVGCPTCVGRAESNQSPFFSQDFQNSLLEDEELHD